MNPVSEEGIYGLPYSALAKTDIIRLGIREITYINIRSNVDIGLTCYESLTRPSSQCKASSTRPQPPSRPHRDIDYYVKYGSD